MPTPPIDLNLHQPLPASLHFNFGAEQHYAVGSLSSDLATVVSMAAVGRVGVSGGASAAAGATAVLGGVGGARGSMAGQAPGAVASMEGTASLIFEGWLDAQVSSAAAFSGAVGAAAAASATIGCTAGLAAGRTGAAGIVQGAGSALVAASGRQGVGGPWGTTLPAFGTLSAEGTWDPNAPRGPRGIVHASHDVPMVRMRIEPSAPWDYSAKARPEVAERWEDGRPVRGNVDGPFKGLDRFPQYRFFPHAEGSPLSTAPFAPYVGAYRAHIYQRTAWTDVEIIQRPILVAPWLRLWKRRSVPTFRFQQGTGKARCWVHRWQIPYPGNRPCWRTPFQDARHPIFIWPCPVIIPPPPPPPPFVPPLDLELRCALPVPLWGSVGFNLGALECCGTAYHIGYEPFPLVGAWIMTHILEIKLISTGETIPVESFELKTDRSSWCWGWSASGVGSLMTLAQTEGQVRIRIDDYYWDGIVEQARARHVLGLSSTTLGGRSLSALLSMPYTARRSRLETQARTIVQIAEDELYNTGWVLDWDLPDWLIPGGIFGYDSMTPIEAIVRLAQSVRAFVYTLPQGNVLNVRPCYKVPSWNLVGSYDVAVPGDTIVELSVDWKPVPLCRGVWISGKAGGVLGRVIRSGTDGVPWAQMEVDELITHQDAARERGIQVLSGTGRRAMVTIQIPVSGDVCGILTPGTVVRVTANPDFYGYVDSVSIRASRADVWQTVVIERVYETP